MAPSPLTLMAERLLANAKLLDEYNHSQGLKPASFDYESFKDAPFAVEESRSLVIDLAQDLKRLAQGPRDTLVEVSNLFIDLANLQFIYRHAIPKHVPLQGDISYADLAKAVALDELLVRRMVRVAMMNRVFIETDEGRVRHSAASRILHEEQGAMDTCGFLLEELFPAAAKMVDSLHKYSGSGEPNETAFNMAFNTSRPFYLELSTSQERTRRFGAAMGWMTQGGSFNTEHLVRGFNWKDFDHEGGLVVDIGGGHGAVSIGLAKATSHIRFVVQDLAVTASQGAEFLSADLQDRVSYVSGDFFDEQTIKGADVYFFRFILHNWSDKYAERILKAVLPAMKDGARILCCDFLPADRSDTAWSRKQPYNLDMIQAIGWNSIERTPSDWERLFKSVDNRLEFRGTSTPQGSAVSLVEARLRLHS